MFPEHTKRVFVKVTAVISSVGFFVSVALFEKQVRASFIDDVQNYKRDGYHLPCRASGT